MPATYTIVLSRPTGHPTGDIGHFPNLWLKKDAGVSNASYNAYWRDANDSDWAIKQINVLYAGVSSNDFSMTATTADGGTPEIDRVRVEANFQTKCTWKISGRDITWYFVEPPEVTVRAHAAIWEFNPEGSGPPVRVKVVLKRQT